MLHISLQILFDAFLFPANIYQFTLQMRTEIHVGLHAGSHTVFTFLTKLEILNFITKIRLKSNINTHKNILLFLGLLHAERRR
jgi:hypothetical protein